MSAHRTVTLTCDHDGCRERYVGAPEANPSRVRTEAARFGGWTSHRESADMLPTRRDLCRWHS